MKFRAGESVRIKDPWEIALTLDENGTLDGLPFMPEMLQHCGTTARVYRSAHKTCDASSIRRLERVVHLEGLHCDGQAHGGCQIGCLFFWHEDWLEAERKTTEAATSFATSSSNYERAAELSDRSTRLHGRDPNIGTFSCQATEIPSITTELSWWSPRQYIDDVRSRNVSLRRLLLHMPIIVFNGYQEASKRVLPRYLWLFRGRTYPSVLGDLSETPTGALDLQIGDKVRVKSRQQVLETLDRNGANRGLTFDWEMLPLCEKEAIVSRRITTVVDETTGRLRAMRQPCVVLEGVTCSGRYHRFCSRSQDSFWRELWLERPPTD